MQQSEEGQSEYAHNLRGAPPAVFEDVDDYELRAYNRGAVLANIYESYVTEAPRGTQLLAKDFALCTRDLDSYFSMMPEHERGDARKAMMEHLARRGYVTKDSIV